MEQSKRTINKVKSEFKDNVNKLVSFIKTVANAEPRAAQGAKELGLRYITPNIIGALLHCVLPSRRIANSFFLSSYSAMGFPNATPSPKGTRIDNVSAYFRSKHGGRYMVLNLSEVVYDYAKFDNQVSCE